MILRKIIVELKYFISNLITMTKINQVYKCPICGNIVEVVHDGAGTLVCCNKEMILMSDDIKLEGKEKHIPVVEKKGNIISVKVGSIDHPMTPEHYIEWIEIITEHRTYKKFLNPNQTRPDQPIAIFEIDAEVISARAYCNLHGLRKIDL